MPLPLGKPSQRGVLLMGTVCTVCVWFLVFSKEVLAQRLKLRRSNGMKTTITGGEEIETGPETAQ